MDRALLVFAKAPVPGRVKTRLTEVLTPEEAARLYRAFVRAALAQYVGLGAAVRLYVAPPAEAFPRALMPGGVTLHAQAGDGLGARMQAAFAESFAAGYGRCVVIGTDHPTLPSAYVREAFEALEGPAPAVSLGPSNDGGYYLLGTNVPLAGLFEGMAYSHGRVFAETKARAERLAERLTVLPPWYDVDTPDDLRRLRNELDATPDGQVSRIRWVLRQVWSQKLEG